MPAVVETGRNTLIETLMRKRRDCMCCPSWERDSCEMPTFLGKLLCMEHLRGFAVPRPGASVS